MPGRNTMPTHKSESAMNLSGWRKPSMSVFSKSILKGEKNQKNGVQMNGHTNGVNGHMNGARCPITGAVSKPANFHNLQNWESGKKNTDRLFAKIQQDTTGCTNHKCLGSIMNPNHMFNDPRRDMKSKDEMLVLAKDFIKEYYGTMKKKNPQMEQKRLDEVVVSIEKTGSYELTYDELVFGCKTSWRNAPRCIGRIQWKQLQVNDARHVKTTKEMFEAMCKHLNYATNNGNLRSCITVFPQRRNYKTQFRVWNAQFVRYAGYKNKDGTFTGDPVNVEFTELCIKLGWKPKRTRFDVLPLLLQANGGDPDVYDIPPELALQVNLRHPKYPWFEELGLKWYAVPGVANMLMDCGGIEYAGCPFNGWYMGTEVGRDLCDVARYNVTEEVAVKMGLDIKNNSSLWKDFALMEVNYAILYSFQQDRVTIMDHHSATESFMEHFANEMETRGGCPGDWVWLSPPVSASLTPIFHQEILNYVLNPAFLYQTDPMKYHEWQGGQFEKKKKKIIRFKSLGTFMLLVNSMMRKTMSKRCKATILYATETGKSLKFAKMLRYKFNHAFATRIVSMEDYDINSLEQESLVLVVASTFGDGDPPDNGKEFSQALTDRAHEIESAPKTRPKPKRSALLSAILSRTNTAHTNMTHGSLPDLSYDFQPQMHSALVSAFLIGASITMLDKASGPLPNLKYSVFGLGSTAYPHFCGFAHTVDEFFEEMQCERMMDVGEGDELSGQEESYKEWAKEIYELSCETFHLELNMAMEPAEGLETYRIVPDVKSHGRTDLQKDMSALHDKHLYVCDLSHRRNLLTGNDGRSTILVQLDMSAAPIEYEPGDHIGVFPCNEMEIVEGVISRIDDGVDPDTLIQLEMSRQAHTSPETASDWNPKRLPVCTIRTALERYLDITSCPSPRLLKKLVEYTMDGREKARLVELAKGKTEYEEWKYYNVPNMAEFLDEFRSIRIDASLLLSQLPILQCRYYSISSSPATEPGEVHITVAVVEYQTQDGTGPIHRGVCSSFLNRLQLGSKVYCYAKSSTFHMPEDHSVPCLLIGPGTGIAPFRSFWQQRVHDIVDQSKEVGEMGLLFGCRHPDQDHLYKDEIEEAQRCRAITLYKTAFSRLPGKPKTYVQNVLKTSLSKVAYDWLVKEKGHLYICGDVSMAEDVRHAFHEVLMKVGRMTSKQAQEHVANMKKNKLFHEDIFGASLKPKKVVERQKKQPTKIHKKVDRSSAHMNGSSELEKITELEPRRTDTAHTNGSDGPRKITKL